MGSTCELFAESFVILRDKPSFNVPLSIFVIYAALCSISSWVFKVYFVWRERRERLYQWWGWLLCLGYRNGRKSWLDMVASFSQLIFFVFSTLDSGVTIARLSCVGFTLMSLGYAGYFARSYKFAPISSLFAQCIHCAEIVFDVELIVCVLVLGMRPIFCYAAFIAMAFVAMAFVFSIKLVVARDFTLMKLLGMMARPMGLWLTNFPPESLFSFSLASLRHLLCMFVLLCDVVLGAMVASLGSIPLVAFGTITVITAVLFAVVIFSIVVRAYKMEQKQAHAERQPLIPHSGPQRPRLIV